MITDGKTITEDISLNPMWSVIKSYGSEEDKKQYSHLHKEITIHINDEGEKQYDIQDN